MLPGLRLLKELEFQEGQKFASFESSCLLLKELGDPQNSFRAVHVAGTNGKGSVCAFINGALMAAGYRTGVTISPHLGSVTERCLINGKPIDEASYSAAVERVYGVANRIGVPMTYFVLALAAAFEVFRDCKIDYGVIECGLGGRFDATNAISNPVATVITSIGFDHTEILGHTIESIASNKAGIAKSGVPLFVAAVDDAAERTIREECRSVGAAPLFLGRELDFDVATSRLSSTAGEFAFSDLNLPLSGEHQLGNAALAVAVAMSLGISGKVVAEGLARTKWPGRLEFISPTASRQATVLLDVAHNPEGIESLVRYLRVIRDSYPRMSFLLSILSRKDWKGMLNELRGVGGARIAFTRSVHPASLTPKQLAAEFGSGECYESPIAALSALSESPGLVVVTGSSFLVGECRMALKTEPFSIYSP